MYPGILRLKNLKTTSYPDFFNGGETLHWSSIAMSILSVNITFEYIQSSAANGFSTGLALGCYEWTSVFVIVLVSFFIIPRFLRLGIITLPQYLELRFNKHTRVMMATLYLLATFTLSILAITSCWLYLNELFGIEQPYAVVLIAITGGTIFYFGGAGARANIAYLFFLIFLVSSSILLIYSLIEVGGITNLINKADGRLRVVLPADDPTLPWTTVFLGGVWLLHLNYWSFSPHICHPMLGYKTLSQTQKGLLLVASIKILLPFLMILPGIVGYEMFRDQITNPEATLPFMIKRVLPGEFQLLISLGYLSMLLTSFTIVLNTATTLFTLDIYGSFFKDKSEGQSSIQTARYFIIVFVIASIAGGLSFKPQVPFFKIATIILELMAPIAASVYLIGLFSKRTPAMAANLAIILGIPLFIIIKSTTDIGSINLAGLEFFVLVTFMLIYRMLSPLKQPIALKEKFEIKFERNLLILIWSIFLITAVCGLYAVFI